MNVLLRFLLVMGLALASAQAQAQAAGIVTVAFRSPEKFTDFGHLPVDVGTNVNELTRVITSVAERTLRAGQSLDIEVLDVDLAGTLRPSRSAEEIRIVNPYDWTRIHLRYQLRNGDAAPVTGDEWIDTKGQTWRETGELFGNERRLLERWFRMRFAGQ